MFELRWLVIDGKRTLQYRQWDVSVGGLGVICVRDNVDAEWTEWKDVPEVVEEELSRCFRCGDMHPLESMIHGDYMNHGIKPLCSECAGADWTND